MEPVSRPPGSDAVSDAARDWLVRTLGGVEIIIADRLVAPVRDELQSLKRDVHAPLDEWKKPQRLRPEQQPSERLSLQRVSDVLSGNAAENGAPAQVTNHPRRA